MRKTSKKPQKRWLPISLGIAILIAWLAYAAVFVYRIDREAGEVLTPEVQQLVKQELQEEWFAIYQHGRRTGYSHTELRPQTEGYALTEEIFLRLNFLDDIQDVFSRIHGRLAPDFSLKSFTFHLQAGPIAFRLRGEIQDANLTLVTSMAGQEQSRQLPLSNPIYLGGGIKAFLAQQHLRVGDIYRLELFDPASLSQTLVPLRVEARETISIDGKDRDAFRVGMDFHGAKLKSWITPYGELLKEEGFLGLTSIKTDADHALKGLAQGAAVDLVRQAAVVPDQIIPDPRHLKRLRLRLTGIADNGWDLAGGRQTWHKGVLTVVRESAEALPTVQIPVNNPDMARHLQPDLLIQSDAPEIKRQADAIVGKQMDALKAAMQISTWVYENVEKRPTLSIPSALDVWKRRAGDCNEHSTLFAALARAAGIPTRIAAGLLYVDDRFFYHAWNEVNVGEWVAVDALLNQVPADPTHVRLIVGGLDRQVELAGVIGRLGIRVLEYE